MTKASKKSLISWIVTLGLPILILLIPTSEAFTGDIRMFFAITLMGIATLQNLPTQMRTMRL